MTTKLVDQQIKELDGFQFDNEQKKITQIKTHGRVKSRNVHIHIEIPKKLRERSQKNARDTQSITGNKKKHNNPRADDKQKPSKRMEA